MPNIISEGLWYGKTQLQEFNHGVDYCKKMFVCYFTTRKRVARILWK